MALAALRLAQVPLVLRVGDKLQMVRIPAGVHAAAVMQLLALWDRAAEELPAKAMGVAVLCFGDAAVGRGGPSEPPAGSQLRMGWLEDGAVDEAFQLGPTGPGPGSGPCSARSCRCRPQQSSDSAGAYIEVRTDMLVRRRW